MGLKLCYVFVVDSVLFHSVYVRSNTQDST